MKKSIFTRYEMSFIVSLAIAMGLRQLAMIMVYPFMSVYCKTLLYSTPALIGIALGIYGLIQGIMQMPFGSLSDRIGRKNVITIGSLFLVSGLALAAISHNIYMLILARALQGIGAVAAVRFSWIGDNIVDEKRNRAMSIVGIFNGAAAVLGFVAGPILYNIIPVPEIFAGCSMLVLLSWIYIVVFVKKDHVEKTDNERAKVDYKGLFKNKSFLKLSISGFFINYLMVAIFYVLPQLLEKSSGSSSTWKVFLPAVVIGIVFMSIASKMADMGKLSMVAVTSFTSIVAGGICLFFTNFIAILIGTILFMSGYMSLNAILPGSVTKLSTKDTRGTVTGLYNTIQYVGSFVGGTLSGILWGINSCLPTVFIIIVSFIGCILVRNLETKDSHAYDDVKTSEQNGSTV